VAARRGGFINTNTGPTPHGTWPFGLAVDLPAGFYTAMKRQDDGVVISIKNGGTMIDYEDEDPEIRRRFEAELKRAGVPCEMPQVSYAGSRLPLCTFLGRNSQADPKRHPRHEILAVNGPISLDGPVPGRKFPGR
jgi:hypothetical protein